VDSRKQLRVVERLRHEVVGAGLDRRELLLFAARGDHHDRQEARGLVVAEPPADLVAVHLRHHDIEQHEVDVAPAGERKRLCAGARADHFMAARREHGLEQADVLRQVVDDEDPRRLAHARAAWLSISAT
jgi:hypothetical protein